MLDGWKDPTAYAAGLAQDAIHISASGRLDRGRAEIIDGHAGVLSTWARDSSKTGRIDRLQFLTADVALLTVYGDIAIGDESTGDQSRRTIETITAHKIDGRWGLVRVLHPRGGLHHRWRQTRTRLAGERRGSPDHLLGLGAGQPPGRSHRRHPLPDRRRRRPHRLRSHRLPEPCRHRQAHHLYRHRPETPRSLDLRRLPEHAAGGLIRASSPDYSLRPVERSSTGASRRGVTRVQNRPAGGSSIGTACGHRPLHDGWEPPA